MFPLWRVLCLKSCPITLMKGNIKVVMHMIDTLQGCWTFQEKDYSPEHNIIKGVFQTQVSHNRALCHFWSVHFPYTRWAITWRECKTGQLRSQWEKYLYYAKLNWRRDHSKKCFAHNLLEKRCCALK